MVRGGLEGRNFFRRPSLRARVILEGRDFRPFGKLRATLVYGLGGFRMSQWGGRTCKRTGRKGLRPFGYAQGDMTCT